MKQSATPSRPWRALAALAALCIALLATMVVQGTWSPRLGLDLSGGTSITLTAVSPGGGTPTDEQMSEAIEIMNNRVNSSGVVEPDIQRSGTNNIVISVANVDEEEILALVGQTAELRFRLVQAAIAGGAPIPEPTVSPAPTGSPTDAPTGSASPTARSTPTARPSPTTANRPVAGLPGQDPTSSPQPSPTATQPATPVPTPTGTPPPQPDPGTGTEVTPEQQAQLEALDCSTLRFDTPDDPAKALLTCNREGTERYLLGPAIINGTQLTSASAGIPQGQVAWVVNLSFDGDATTTFAQVTRELAGTGEQFAIVLDGRVISAPTVNEPIPNGQAQISGNFTQEDAQDLANILQYGALPLTFTPGEVTTVSPQLGGEQLRAGIVAGAVGLVLVVVYSLLFYRALGIVSIFSLAVAALLTWTSVVVLGSTIGFTLILAGVIGVIVSIGITADSFVVFFERVRDEIREGRSTRVAVENGWRRARRTILVADGVTFLAALVLYILAIGRVQNFAFTLGLTTLIDIVVVFLFTKPVVTLLVRRKFFGQGHPLSGLNPERIGRQVPVATLKNPRPRSGARERARSRAATATQGPSTRGTQTRGDD